MRNLFFLALCLPLLWPAGSVHAAHTRTLTIHMDNRSFDLPVQDDVGGLSLSAADLGLDGIPELIVGNGLGLEPRVRVLRQDGSQIGSFLVYAPTLGVGVNVIACDLNADGYNEIVTAPQRGGGPHVRIFDHEGNAIDHGGFFAYDGGFRGGVNLACGDLTGDAYAELVTLPAPGGGPHVRVWSFAHESIQLLEEFFPFDQTERSGLTGTVADGTLFAVQQFTQTPVVKRIVIHNEITVLDEQPVASITQGVHSIVVHNHELYLSSLKENILYNVTQKTETQLETSNGSLAIISQDLDADGDDELIYTAGRPGWRENETGKQMMVDISEQRLYASQDGILENSFFISSGLGNATPLGKHQILAKIPFVHYAWYYGENNPNNYDLGWVPYNLKFYPHIYIHYAPWHNNFGHKMSHGCVNVSLEDMQWLYEWAEEGMTVMISE